MCHWKHLGGVNNTVDLGTRAFNIEELKGRERTTGPACVKRQESEWPISSLPPIKQYTIISHLDRS